MNDLRYAIRQLFKSPGFSFVAVLTLALGIGANTAIFQMLDAVRLRSLPVSKPQEIVEVRIAGGNPGMGISDGVNSEMTYPLWQQVRPQTEAFSGLFAWSSQTLPLGRGADARAIKTLLASAELFPTLDLTPVRGRFFESSEDRPGVAAGGVVISHAFWQREFGGQDSALGKKMVIGGQNMEVIGVTPPNFGLEIGRNFDVIIPISMRAVWWNGILDRTDAWWLRVMGRLKPGWSTERANEYAKTFSAAVIEATLPVGYAAGAVERYRTFKLAVEKASNGVSSLRKDYERSLWLLLGITGLVLLIACVNLANLSLARASSRVRELAVRLAIGASRGRILRQMLCESLVLAAAGVTLGILLAGVLSNVIISFLGTSDTDLSLEMHSDWRVLGFTATVGVLTCVVFGLAPALRFSKVDPIVALKSGGRGSSGGRDRHVFQRALAVGQVAVSLILLAGALLLVRSFWNLMTTNAGFQQEGVLVAYLGFDNLTLPAEQRLPFQQRILDGIRALPQIQSAASTTHVPLGGSSWTMGLRITPKPDVEDTWSKVTWISPRYFDTLGCSLVKGRDFDERDTATSQKVAVVNETLVRRYFAHTDPIGATVQTMAEPGYPEAAYQIVGVVKDTKYGDLRGEIPPTTFAPATQIPEARNFMAMVIRHSGATAESLAAVRKGFLSINPEIRAEVFSMRANVLDRLARERLMAWLSGFFGAVALTLVLIGLYGLVSYMTLARRNELGIRLALGAQNGSILWLVVRQGFHLTTLGIVIGLAGALALTRFLGALLFDVTPTDPLTFASISILLLAIASFASWLPARRATRLDPMIALRCE